MYLESLSYKSIIDPLLKFKIMNCEQLYKDSNQDCKFASFRRKLSRLEKKGILKSKLSVCPHRKTVYLDPMIVKSRADESFTINEDTYFHDYIAGCLGRSLMDLKMAEYVELEHEFIEGGNWNYQGILEPDLIVFTNNNQRIGFEIELVQKSRKRIFDKMKLYCKSSFYDSALWFFTDYKLYEKYINFFKQLLLDLNNYEKKNMNSKIGFIYNSERNTEKNNLIDARIYINEKEQELVKRMK